MTENGAVTGHSVGMAIVKAVIEGAVDSVIVRVMNQSELSRTPHHLLAIAGPLIRRQPSAVSPSIADFDNRYQLTEQARFNDYLACEGTCVNEPNHYGGLRSRLMWALRNGEPIGPSATDEAAHAYARGRRIVRNYLMRSKGINFALDPHQNTGLADVETLYVLDGDLDALTHIHVTAARMTTWGNGRLEFQHSGSDARMVTVALQAFGAAHRLRIAYDRNPVNTSHRFDPSPGSWKAAGERQIGWIDQYAVKADGSIPSPAHGGEEAYLFNAWLATALLQWCAHIQWHARAFELARLIVDHLIDVHHMQHNSWQTLPYTTTGTTAAHDLAAFYVWPSLALWQETGDVKYYNFAVLNLKATTGAWLDGIKQWNQTFSTLAQSTESLLHGVGWR